MGREGAGEKSRSPLATEEEGLIEELDFDGGMRQRRRDGTTGIVGVGKEEDVDGDAGRVSVGGVASSLLRRQELRRVEH